MKIGKSNIDKLAQSFDYNDTNTNIYVPNKTIGSIIHY